MCSITIIRLKNNRMKKEENRDAKLIDRARHKCKGDCGMAKENILIFNEIFMSSPFL